MSWRQQLKDEVAFIRQNDPAAGSFWEVVLCYPGLHALYLHRLAHFIYQRNWKVLGRFLSQFNRWLTGIEIHPAAQIASKVFIDHGMGVVIGATAQIEEEVVLYHGVTLGGMSHDPVKRHPTIKRGVLIGAHAQLLGAITIGEYSRIGAGAVVTRDVPPQSTVGGVPARPLST